MKKSIVTSLILLTLVFAYNACSRGFTPAFSPSDSSNLSSFGPPAVATLGGGNAIENKLSLSLQTSEQIFASSLSLTNILADSAITNEYNLRSALFSSGYDLNMVTTPMWMGITNVNSVVCQRLVTKEAGLVAAQRVFFKSIDFSKPVNQVTDALFLTSAEAFSVNAFGRNLYLEEQNALIGSKVEFVSAVLPGDVANVQQTKNLMLYLCTAMISTVEAISL